MKILLHTCCGPCLIYPLRVLESKRFEVTGYFFNPNIHPYKEFRRRLDSLTQLAENETISLISERDYDLDLFLENVVPKRHSRCSICYDIRLQKTVEYAVRHGFSAFSTTLLYSRFQQHEAIVKKSKELAKRFSISFVYEDFRIGWQEGIDAAIAKGLYRQPYCGCLYSEQERYDNRLKKKLRHQQKTFTGDKQKT